MHPRPRLVLVPAALAALALVFCAPASAAVPKLPKRFLWGVSGSGFQSEGHTTDANWNHYIERDSRPGVEEPKEPYRNSVDFYRRYRSDIGLAAGLGVNVYRISHQLDARRAAAGQVLRARVCASTTASSREMRRRGIQPLDHASTTGTTRCGSTTRAAGRARRRSSDFLGHDPRDRQALRPPDALTG